MILFIFDHRLFYGPLPTLNYKVDIFHLSFAKNGDKKFIVFMLLPSSDTHGYINGQPVRIFTLKNNKGLVVRVSELGAHLTNVIMDGEELTLGHGSFNDWMINEHYLGATCGRFGNRIADGILNIGKSRYQLATNNSPAGVPCHLHGGPTGFHTKVWRGEALVEQHRQGVSFALRSHDGDEGYPGNMDIKVTYWLNDNNELSWYAKATTDQPTAINLINHTYWNLSGDFDSPITDHTIQIHADYFLPTNSGMIPTGEIRPVIDTPMDFTRPRAIGENMHAPYEPIQIAGGYDHCWVLRDHHDGNKATHTAAIVHHPGSGRTLEVLTNQPGIQFYTGNFLSSPHMRYSSFCLESEAFPDSPNKPHFPPAILKPGETYQHELIWKLSR